MLVKTILCWLVFALSFLSADAQKKDTVISVKIIKPASVIKTIEQDIDSVQKHFFISQDATALLEANSNTYVKNYGLSNLSTLSIRGSSVAQTNVLWNNIPIQNTMLGLTDLSTIPNLFFDKMTVQPSGFAQKNKAQSIAGRLDLKTKFRFSEGKPWNAMLMYGYESFRNHLFGGKIGYSNKKFNIQAKVFRRQGQNVYSYDNFYTVKKDEIKHSAATQNQIMLDAATRISKHHLLSFHYWKINNIREIAPLAFGQNVGREERGKINRFGVNHSFVKERLSIHSSLGLTVDSFIYEDTQIALLSLAQVKNLPLNSSLTYRINESHEVGIGYNQQLSFYYQKDRNEKLTQFGSSIFYNFKHSKSKLLVNTFLKKQYANIGKHPFTYGLRVSKNIAKQHLIYTSFNTNYRLPSLNELYYFPGGNENLKPETSKNFEFGGKVLFKRNKFSVEDKLNFYSRWVDDWIVWSGSSIFFPDNIAEVWSRGMENNLTFKYQTKKWSLRNTLLFAYNRATSQRSYFANDQSVGKQIPYVPRTTWRNNLYAQYQKFSAQLFCGYTGYRFITRDESAFVEPCFLVNTFLGYSFQIDNWKLNTKFKLNNITNESYESVRGRIMPQRNFAISIIAIH